MSTNKTKPTKAKATAKKATPKKVAKPVSDNKTKLTQRAQAFVREYLIDLNATQAAIRAGYSEKTAHSQGPRMLENVGVKNAIAEAMKKRASAVELSAERVLLEASRLALYDIRRLYNADGTMKAITELDDDTAAAIVGIDVIEVGGEEPSITKKYKLADKNSALERLFKHLGLYELDNSQKTDPLTTLLQTISQRSNNSFNPVAKDGEGE